jgi:SAM-dependent methyltransferase
MNKRHPLHSMCSYLGCFPPRVPYNLIRRLFSERDVVLDPFCGSGTTLVEARQLGHSCVGVDLNPLAVAIAKAKMQDVDETVVLERLGELASQFSFCLEADTSVLEQLQTFFHPRTLTQLRYLRNALDPSRSEDLFLQGALLGIMHGKFRKNKSTAYLSIDMPNTFSMSPTYVEGYVKKHDLKQPPVDVFSQLAVRTRWLLREMPLPRKTHGRVFHGNATALPEILDGARAGRIAGIVTSPPYLGILRYGAFNWIRLWFLRCDAAPVDRMLDGTDSMDRYLGFMVSFLRAAADVLSVDAPMALVIGDVHEFGTRVNLAKRVWDELGGLVPFEMVRISYDRFDESVKTTRIWGEEKKGRATPMDRVLLLRRIPKRSRRLSRRTAPGVALSMAE